MYATTTEVLINDNLAAAIRGNQAAYGRIVAACQNSVTAIALSIVRDVPASEDIAQEAFLNAWQNLNRLKNPASFLPWLRQITRNLARDHLRLQHKRSLETTDADVAIKRAADPGPDPAQHAILREREHAAAELISALPPDSRDVVLLFYREGESSRQVAALLGLSDAAVRKRLSRARATVRKDLLARFGSFAHDSAPSAAFTGMVASALTVSAPSAAAGSIFASAAGGGKSVGSILMGAAGSIGFALVASLLVIYLGLRRFIRAPFSKREQRGLIRSGMISWAASLGFLATLLLVATYADDWLSLAMASAVVFLAIVFYQSSIVQPRVLKQRHAEEARRDPAAAALRRQRERRLNWIGTAVGAALSVAALAYAVVAGTGW